MLAVGVGLASALARVDGFTAGGRPILTWRWLRRPTDPTAQPILVQPPVYNPPVSDRPVDLTQTSAHDYPSFRGKDRTGVVPGVALFRDWTARPPDLLWSHPLTGGQSSVVIVGDWCINQEQRGDDEAVVCYELRTGRECWNYRYAASFYEYWGGTGPRATPTVHRGRVYALGASGILNCLDGRTGKPIWTIDVLKDNGAENRIFGVVASPLVVDGKVIVSPGGPGRSLVAYDEARGTKLWAAGDAAASYSSPLLADLCGRRQVLIFNAEGLYSHDLKSGAILWSVPWVSNPTEKNNVCQPVPLHDGNIDCVFLASGYHMGCTLLEVREEHHGFVVRPRWSNQNVRAKFASVVERDGFVYGFDERILVCIDWRTGERRWRYPGRFEHGQVLAVGDSLLVQGEKGELALGEATPRGFTEFCRFQALKNRTWNLPAFAGDLLLVRNQDAIACYRLPLRNQ
jgi:outer membrane protein assembly factor BamB